MMVIDIPKETTGDKDGFFLRSDVRETAGISGAPTIGDFTSAQHAHNNAATGGTIDHPNLTSVGSHTHSQIDTHVDGDGSDHSDVAANTAASHAESHNMASHTDDYSEGEGINISAGNVISGENATITNKGIASFATADFSVASGVVSASGNTCKTLDGDTGTATASSHNFDILGGEGIDTVGESNNITISAEIGTAGNRGVIIAFPGEGINVSYTSGTATISGEDSTAGNKGIVIVAGGEGMDVSYSNGIATISGENATISNKGIASFNTNDFTVASGAVSLKSKTSYASVNSYSFIIEEVATNGGNYSDGSTENDTGFGRKWFAGIQLPHGAIITAVFVSATHGTWFMKRQLDEDPPEPIASGNAATQEEDTSISNAVVDNQTYSYFIEIDMQHGNFLNRARVTYTTDYD